MHLSSQASTADTNRDSDDHVQTLPPKLSKYNTPEPPVLAPLDGIDFDEGDNSEPIRVSAFDFGIQRLRKV